MKNDICGIYPNFDKFWLWVRTMAWQLVESVSKEPGLVWKQKMPRMIDNIKGLFFVGNSTISYGIGTDAAAHSALLCYPKVSSYVKDVWNLPYIVLTNVSDLEIFYDNFKKDVLIIKNEKDQTNTIIRFEEIYIN